MTKFDFTKYISPLSWRYGSPAMREIFSEQHKYELWRKIWITLARVEYKAGVVSKEELDDLIAHGKDIDIDTILTLEKETGHDVVAAIREFAGKAKIGGGKIHLGATSMDIVDNADALRVVEAITLVEKQLLSVLTIFAEKINIYADVACMGFTHLQPAEPTTIGYRLSGYAQDFLTDLKFLEFVRSVYKGKGMKGAVGTRASYTALLKETNMSAGELDDAVMTDLGLSASTIATQVYPRKFDYLIMSLLSSVAASAARFAGDVRLMQSAGFGEWGEPFGKTQVGSSAMPFKRNPVNCENICSLARYITALPQVSAENSSLNYLERTLDDSANKRIFFPEGFLALDEILVRVAKVVSGLVVYEDRVVHNLAQYAPFAAMEPLLIALVQKGADRQHMHELLRTISMKAWKETQEGKVNPMQQLIEKESAITKYLSVEEIRKNFSVELHVGDAPTRAKEIAKEIKQLR